MRRALLRVCVGLVGVLGLLILVAVAGMLVTGTPVRVPWQPQCTIVDAEGHAVATGSPEQLVDLLDRLLVDSDSDSDAVQPADGVDPDQVRDALGAGPALSCAIAAIPVTDGAKEPPLGLTPAAQELRSAIRDVFGPLPDGGYGTEEVLPGRSPDGEHSLGRALDVMFRPPTDPEQVRAGWLLANWAVANAERLSIRTVIYADHIWTARRSAQGWRPYRFGGADPDNPVNRHLDHVHLDTH